jgi:adenylate kinase
VAPERVIEERLGGRRDCPKCGAIYHVKNSPPQKDGICDQCGNALITREDQRPEVIQNRLEVYRKQTQPLIAYYRTKNLLREVNAVQPIDDVFADIQKALA